MRGPWCCGLLLFAAASAQAQTPAQDTYGVGIICPRADTQVTFYTENDQQDAAGTIAFQDGRFLLTSDSITTLKSAGAQEVPSACDNGMPGIRIDAKRDGWMQAGRMWVPPNQEWDYGDWQDFLRKAAIWKPVAPVRLYQGSMDAPYKDKPYDQDSGNATQEIYPLKFTDDFALVLVDETDAFAKACAGTPVPPKGALGWMRLSADDGKPVAVPVHSKGCAP